MTQKMEPKLSKAQAELLDAMRKGVTCYYMPGIDAYYWRTDTRARCTRTVFALLDKGVAEQFDDRGYSGHRVRAATTQGAPSVK